MEKRLLAMVAHPDDESFGIGGTLARYAAEGVDVHVIIATDGAAGSVADGFEEARERLVEVRAEELDQATAVLGVTLHKFNYRDSGYIGDPANEHPEAFIQVEMSDAVGRVVKLIRELQPQVIITHDETGGYFHPDHIQCYKVTTAAFQAAADPTQYTQFGLPPHQAQKLYYTAFPNTWVKFFVFLMRLRRQDPTKVGRNKDIDMTRLGTSPEKIHARVDYRHYWNAKRAASAAHASQGGGGGGRLSWLPTWLQKRLLGKENFIRAVPPAPNGYREADLFKDVVTEEAPLLVAD